MADIERAEVKIKIMTLNVWGLPKYFTKDKAERLDAIGSHLAQGDYDVVCLQEVWCQSDYRTLVDRTKLSMPYNYYFYSGLNGSGLCVLSRWPIVEAMFLKWSLNGYFYMVHHADWFGGKGVGLLQIDIAGYLVNVYTTHTHAQYEPEENDHYLGHRLAQSLDTAMLIKRTCQDAHLTVLAGDLNCIPSRLCIKSILCVAQLSDTYELHDKESSCGTYGSSRNGYSQGLGEDGGQFGDRIDYILYKPGNNTIAKVETYSFPLEERIPGHDFSYSDHEAIAVTIRLTPSNDKTPDAKQSEMDSEAIEVLSKCVNILETSAEQLERGLKLWKHGAVVGGLVTAVLAYELVATSWFGTRIVDYVVAGLIEVALAFCCLSHFLWIPIELNSYYSARDSASTLLRTLLRKRSSNGRAFMTSSADFYTFTSEELNDGYKEPPPTPVEN